MPLNSSEYIIPNGRKFDILKLLLAFFVVAIHTTPVTDYLRPLYRIAVPLFFLMSSYFFFLKLSVISSPKEQKKALKHFSVRIIKLYLFWTIALLPWIIYQKKWYVLTFETIFKIVKSVFISGTFGGAWYLTATIISIFLIWCLSQKISNKKLLFVGFISYSICCLTSNYISLFTSSPLFVAFYKGYSFLFGTPSNSFLAPLFFVVIGKILAENKLVFTNKVLYICFFLSAIFLFAESFVVTSNKLNFNSIHFADDCYFCLIPFCVTLFMIIGQKQVYVNFETKFLRQYSTIIYCSHITVKDAVVFCGDFCTTSLMCICLCFMITQLEKFQRFRWLKYSH